MKTRTNFSSNRLPVGPAALLLAAALLPASALAQDTQTIAGGIENVDEALLGPTAPGGVRPDNLPKPAADSTRWQDRVSLTLGVDWTNGYFGRGIRQEDEGFIIQPYATLSIAAWKAEDFTLNVNFSTWHSFQDKETAAVVADDFYRKWYEADYTVGASVNVGKWTFGAAYNWFGSPSGALVRVEEIAVAASYDDSEWLGAWAMKPAVQVNFETAEGTSDGRDRGVYLQLGVTPGFDVALTDKTNLRVDLPVTAGFSLKDFYQDAAGNDDVFGFLQAGPKLSAPLPLPDGWGTWTVSGSASYLFMGDNVASFNGGKDGQWLFTVGVSVAF